MFDRKRDGTPREAVGLIWFPARLFLRKLGAEGSDYFARPGNLTGLSQSKDQALKYKWATNHSFDPHTYSISERRVSRFSLSAHSSSVSPACTKQPRQSPLWCTRTTPQQCGHSSCSCGLAERESERLVKSIFHCPSFV